LEVRVLRDTQRALQNGDLAMVVNMDVTIVVLDKLLGKNENLQDTLIGKEQSNAQETDKSIFDDNIKIGRKEGIYTEGG